MSPDNFFSSHPQIFAQQRKEWTKILIDWKTRNPHAVMDVNKSDIGTRV
jgi:hypothetical protein